MKYPRTVLVLFLIAVLCTVPVMGVTTYINSQPQLSATISGVNEFAAGEDTTINVLVRNNGLSGQVTSWVVTPAPQAQPNIYQPYLPYQGSGTIERDDVPTTAKMLSVGIDPLNAPIVIKSDPQTVGDLPTLQGVMVPISAKILANAPLGEYNVNLTLRYTYLASSDQRAADVLQSNYVTVNQTIPLTIVIKPQVKIEVLNAVGSGLNVGTEGYVNLTLQNIGSYDGKKATIQILRSGTSPVIPTDSSVYVGDFPQGMVVNCSYKVVISSDAEKQTYPLDVVVNYENKDGDMVNSDTETVGIPVGGKIVFSVVSPTPQLIPGTDNTVEIVYKNTGDATAYHAQVRLSAVSPFTSSDDTSYLGDMNPGDTVSAKFHLSVDPAANASSYALDTQVRYRDTLDNSQVSDTFRVPVTVLPRAANGSTVQYLAIVLILVAIAAGAGYYVLRQRKKK